MKILYLILALFICESHAQSKYYNYNSHFSLNNDFSIQFGMGKDLYYNNYFSHGNGLSTFIMLDDHNLILSYEALFPGLFHLFGNFSDSRGVATLKSSEFLTLSILNLINGDIGYQFSFFDISFKNQFNLFFTRYAYHHSGINIGFGDKKRFGIYIMERDRLDRGFDKLMMGITYKIKEFH